MKRGITDLFKSQCAPVPDVETADLTGQTVLVTGANAGLGFEATKHFATMNPGRIIMGCRNLERGNTARDKIQEATGYERISVWQVDLSKFASIVDFASKFEADGGRLDIAVLNAGIYIFKYETTVDNWESILQINHLSSALMSLLLLPTMIKTAVEHSTKPRLVLVNTEMHYWSTINKKTLASQSFIEKCNEKAYCTLSMHRYEWSKLINLAFARALAERLGPDPLVIVNLPNPGYCVSGLRKDMPLIMRAMDTLSESALARTSEEGSRQLVYAAVGEKEDPRRLHGQYINLSQPCEPSDEVLGEQGHRIQERIWSETIDIIQKASGNVRSIIDQYLNESAS